MNPREAVLCAGMLSLLVHNIIQGDLVDVMFVLIIMTPWLATMKLYGR